MKQLKNVFYKLVLALLLIFMIYVTYSSIFNIYTPSYDFKPIILIIGTIVILSLFITLKHFIDKISEKTCNVLVLIISLIFFILLLIVGNSIKSNPTADLSNIIKEVKVMLQNGGKVEDTWYFSMYSNQVPLLTLIYFITKIKNIFLVGEFESFLIVIHAVSLTITAVLTYLSVKKISDYKSGLLTLIFFVINPVMYIYASYYYTDTLCMPFVMMGIYLYISGVKGKKNNNIILSLIFSGIAFAISIKIRVVCAILVIGLVIGLFLSNEKYKKIIIKIVYLIIGIVIGVLICKGVESRIDFKEQDNYKFPIYHWIMLGSNQKNDGRFSIEDWNYTNSKSTYEEKKNADKEKIIQRYKEIWDNGLISFLKTKLRVVWTNGTYNYHINIVNVENKNMIYDYTIGNKSIFLHYYMQILKIVILVLFLCEIITRFKQKEIDFFYSGINISIFGAFIFYLMWEVMTKYSLSFLPWMFLAFHIGINSIEKIFNTKMIRFDDNQYIDIGKTLKIISIVIIGLTIVLVFLNYYKYAVKKDVYNDIRVNQQAERDQKINKIADKMIKQEFETGKSFNQVVLKFLKGNTTSNTNYVFELYRADGEKLLYKEEFSSKEIENKKEKKFSFKSIKPYGMQKYYIKIYSNNATMQNSIGLASYYQKNYSPYPGVLTINGIKQDTDLTFKVQNEVTRTYISKKVYILLSFFVILIEIFAFYPFLTYNRSVKEIEGGI